MISTDDGAGDWHAQATDFGVEVMRRLPSFRVPAGNLVTAVVQANRSSELAGLPAVGCATFGKGAKWPLQGSAGRAIAIVLAGQLAPQGFFSKGAAPPCATGNY